LIHLVFDAENPTNPFALTAALRGLCEDIIGLKYMSMFDPSDRNEAIILMTVESTFDFIEKQKAFFALYHPQQLIFFRQRECRGRGNEEEAGTCELQTEIWLEFSQRLANNSRNG
jgi:hypothetical protein